MQPVDSMNQAKQDVQSAFQAALRLTESGKRQSFAEFEQGLWTLLLPLPLIVAGIFVCIWWRQLLLKYKKFVGFRIDRLREMEEHPDMQDSIRMYHMEDKLYPRTPEGKMIQGKGLDISDLETRLPRLFVVLYCVFGFILFCILAFRISMCIAAHVGVAW